MKDKPKRPSRLIYIYVPVTPKEYEDLYRSSALTPTGLARAALREKAGLPHMPRGYTVPDREEYTELEWLEFLQKKDDKNDLSGGNQHDS